MPSTTASTPTNHGHSPDRRRPAWARSTRAARRPQLPLVVVGVLLVVGCALVFAEASLHVGSREQVLVTSKPLVAGQLVAPGDLRAAQLSTGPGVEVVSAGDEGNVVGRPAAVSLAAGAVLTPNELGSLSPVPSGSDVVALGLKAGQYPPGLSAGDNVQVVPVSSSSTSPSPARRRTGRQVRGLWSRRRSCRCRCRRPIRTRPRCSPSRFRP